eukprot:2677536-Amphidinium_carterae.1
MTQGKPMLCNGLDSDLFAMRVIRYQGTSVGNKEKAPNIGAPIEYAGIRVPTESGIITLPQNTYTDLIQTF